MAIVDGSLSFLPNRCVRTRTPVAMDCHPLFVFRKRRAGLLEIAEFPRFIRRTRYVGEQRPEFGCFGSELLRSEHLTRPFYGRREHNWSPPCRRRRGLH